MKQFLLLTSFLIVSFSVQSQCMLDNAPPGQFIDTENCVYVDAPAGTFSPGGNVTSPTLCASGFIQPQTGQSSCFACSAGTSQAQEGQTSCDVCEPGEFQANSGASSCDLCDPGFVQPNAGATECIGCEPGKFQAQAGQAVCEDCAEGSAQPNTGATECFDCDPGTFQSVEGQSECEDCPVGTFNDTSGNTMCMDCADGTGNENPGSTSCDVVLGNFDIDKAKFTFSPNPTKGVVNIQLNKRYENFSVTLFTFEGKQLWTRENNSAETLRIDISKNPVGQYVVVLLDAEGNKAVINLIKN